MRFNHVLHTSTGCALYRGHLLVRIHSYSKGIYMVLSIEHLLVLTNVNTYRINEIKSNTHAENSCNFDTFHTNSIHSKLYSISRFDI